MRTIENSHTVSLKEHDFMVHEGIDDMIAAQLVLRSQEPQVIKHHPADSVQFATIDSVYEWVDVNPNIYTLTRKQLLKAIATIDKHCNIILDTNRAFHMRTYGDAEAGSFTEFGKTAILDYETEYDDGSMWADVDTADDEMLERYRKLGFGVAKSTLLYTIMHRPGVDERRIIRSHN